ncbi:MAG TPA: BamA/TamA family outer membrane protein [Gemmataceae bacterium]
MIRRVQIEGNKVYTEDELKALTEARPGEYYDRNVIQADIERIRDYYGARGRLVPVAEKVYLNEDAPGEVFVHYEIHEREPARVGRIIIQGNTVTRDNVILRQVPLYPGQILSYPDLITAEQNLARLGIFAVDPAAGVRPTVTVLEPETDSPFKDILVQVQEQPTGSFMLGLGVNSNAGLSGSIVLNERNFDITRFPTSFEEILAGRAFRGAGQEFRLEAVPGTIFQRYSASFREPSVFDSPFSLATSIYYFTRGYAEYNENRYGGRLTVGRQITPIWSTFGTLRVEGINIHDVPIHAPFEIRRFVGDSFLLGLRAGVTRDTRDSFLRPTTGSLFEASFEQAFGDDTFPLGTVEATRYWTTYQRIDGSGKHVLALRTQASWAGPDTPIYEQFFAGGFGSIRGFEFRGVGPFENGFNTGGRFAFLNSLEYQIPILANDRVFFVSFLDSGAVESTTTIRDYRVTAGVGLRLAVPGMGPVPIALDFGFPIVKGPGDREQIFAFWLGFFN